MKLSSFLIPILVLIAYDGIGQEVDMSNAICIAREQSVEAKEARQSFISIYWAYRSYKASRLPSFNLYGGLMNFDRSLTLMQSYEDGSFQYVNSYNLQNSLGLQVSQNLTFTGGTLSVYSDLSRIDQFGMDKSLTWYSQPVTVSYYQPLFTYNQFKWDKKIEPKEYEKGKRQYMESMELITINTVRAYHSLILARMNNDIATSNYANTGKMLSVARERQMLGSVTRDELLQLELRMLNDSISINETAVAVREAQMRLHLEGVVTGIAVVLECGEYNNIHPVHKTEVARRLAIQALYHVFGIGTEEEVYGPVFRSCMAKGSKLFINFYHAEHGFSVRGEEIKNFEIAGEDGKFVPAKAEVKGSSVVLKNATVKTPVAARYMWIDYAEVTLFGENGLPVAPFNTLPQ